MKTKNIKKVFAMVLMALGAIVPLGVAHAADNGWGPERATFTWEKPASYVTFNSITNNPELGDERNFVRVRKAGTEDTFTDSVELEVGAEYEVYIYYHNNASANLNHEDGKGIAGDVKMRTGLPEKLKKGESGVVMGAIYSSNANPTQVYDEAYLKANETVYLSYVPNSAVIHNHGTANGSVLDAGSLFSREEGHGAKLAHYNEYWGMIPGCNEYAGYVTYRIKVDKPGFWMEKTARVGEDDYKERVFSEPGSTVDFKILYKNTGTTIQKSVIVYDAMPEGMTYIPGTTFVKTNTNETGEFVVDKLFNGGLVLGDFRPGEWAEITYKVEISNDKDIFPCGTKKIYNNSSVATINGTEYDKVEVAITRDCGEKQDSCRNEDGTLKDTPECKSCFNEDGSVKDTPECKCYNEDGSVKDTPECKATPSELPSTGPTEMVLTVVILSGVWIAVAYWYRSRSQLKKLTKSL